LCHTATKYYILGMDKELRTNAKSLSPEEQFQLRRSIIRLSKAGKKIKEVAEILDVSKSHIKSIRIKYKKEGFAGISLKQRGRRVGEQRLLTVEQEKKIRDIIVDKTPEQLKLRCCMWTRKSIGELIKRQLGITVIPSTLGYYLERWGFSVQRPLKKAYKQDPKKVQQWLNETYPAINKQAKAQKAEIYWGDETGIQNTADYLRGYAPIGKTPIVRVDSQKFKVNMLSAVSPRGKVRFVIYDKMTPDTLIDFMRRLVKDSDGKVILILDNLRVHHATKVSQWLEKHKEEIEVFYLPPYAPEHNPDEFLNSDLKRDVGNRPMPRSEEEIVHNVRSYMKNLQSIPEKVKSFFKAPTVSYAAI